jgi:hypothetical protein
MEGRGHSLRSNGGFDGLDYGVKAFRIRNRDFAEHLSVQRDVGLLASVDELAVPYAAHTAGRAQPRNPQPAEVPFSAFPPDSSVDIHPDHSFFGQTKQVPGRGAMALDCFEDSFPRLASCGAFFYSWHISFPLRVPGSLRLLAAAEWKGPHFSLYGKMVAKAEKQARSIVH